ncbi:MAG: pyridoxal 5'-phosphate synthase glutaminase subunit PdxT [Acidimicrobiia bacterium]
MLALQGAFREHREVLDALGVDSVEVRTPDDLSGVDTLFLPGGESTTMTKLVDSSGLRQPIVERIAAGMPVFATCAGLILLARDVLDGRADQQPLGLLDVTVRRNAYGRQRESFEAPLAIAALTMDGPAGDGAPGVAFRGIFIRAPVIEQTGATVDVLAVHGDHPVLVRSGTTWAATFHPELSGDIRLHRRFLDEAGGD